MRSRLEQEYRIWLEELLEVLQELCEDIVPAGRTPEEAYWRTKALYSGYDSGERATFLSELLQYGAEGRAVLAAVKSEMEAVKAVQVTDRDTPAYEEENRGAEETMIRLRRVYAFSILSSLQSLVNFAFLADLYLQETKCSDEASDIGSQSFYRELGSCFEIDDSDQVKRIRSGVVATGRVRTAQVKQYRTREQRQEAWRNPHPVAG